MSIKVSGYARSQVSSITVVIPDGISRDAGTGGGGRRGNRPRCPLPGGARGAMVPFQFKGLPWQNSELSEILVQFFYEFAPENARNAVVELQE